MAQSQAKMDLQASLFGRECANVLPSPPESPSMHPYPPAPGEDGQYNIRLATRHVLLAPPSTAVCGSAETVGQACDKKISASQSQENTSRNARTPLHSSSLHDINTFEDFNSMISNMRAPKVLSPDQASDHPRIAGPLKQRPTRASSTASHHTPQLVLTEAGYQSEGDELFTGSEEDDGVVGGSEAVKPGPEQLAEKRKMKRFRSMQTSSH
ncbi:MAG: hypothetical protein ALECFALPRED_010338 [Alectoria fallacina]|uniref:Uncharacterized protein n=1 Tax=Alectoria fallacina TaxID=1903189 RepID=A0A8H3F0E8_9LECA|nr:MAG: hypothetical protein ALECFALPRED_010338 [Alectoria fallacina]